MSAPSIRRYKNGKTPNFFKKKRREEKRKSVNTVTVERAFGEDFPAYGASLGADFNHLTGVISKTNRSSAKL